MSIISKKTNKIANDVEISGIYFNFYLHNALSSKDLYNFYIEK